MPARRFWTMEAGINRVLAELDLRKLNVVRAQNKDHAEETVNRLVSEIGETCRIKRPKFVKAYSEAKDIFNRIME